MGGTRRETLAACGAALAFTLGGCGRAGPTPRTAFGGLAEEIGRAALADRPEAASRSGLSADALGLRFEALLDDRSQSAIDRRRSAALRWRAQLGGLGPKAVAMDEAVLHRALADHFALLAPGAAFGFGRFDLADGFSPYVLTPALTAALALPARFATPETPASIEAALERLEAVGPAIDAETRHANADAARGVVPPLGALDRLARGLAVLIAQGPALSPFLAGLRTAGAGIDARRLAQAEAVLGTRIVPALRRQNELVQSLRPRAATAAQAREAAAGPSFPPGGEEYYRAAFAFAVGARVTPEAAAADALARIQALDAGIDRQLALLGAGTTGAPAQRLAALAGAPTQRFAAPADALAALDAALAVMARLPGALGAPEGRAAVGAFAPEHRRALALGGLELDPSSLPPRFAIKPLAASAGALGLEGLAAMTGAEGVSHWRRLGPPRPFAEAWSAYALAAADAAGAFAGDAGASLGRLLAARADAAALEADVGLHAQGWTRARALARLGETLSPMAAEARVDAILAEPGAAAAADAGAPLLLGLRKRAEAALARGFDLQGFHRMLAGLAAISPAALAAGVDAWIATPARPDAQKR
jgi:uncharacterized protein (DUF885 family)